MFGYLQVNRAIATRYDQLANSFRGMIHLATARHWFNLSRRLVREWRILPPNRHDKITR